MIIGISGKIGSGKDTAGKIIQMLTQHNSTIEIVSDLNQNINTISSGWEIKKFAGKLKQIVSLFTGIPVYDLEKQEVKDSLLGEEWKVFEYEDDNGRIKVRLGNDLIFDELAESWTVRKLLQKVGTEAMRDVIHPNVWVNALFADYKAISLKNNPQLNVADYSNSEFPNWIITDMRFPNELKAVKDRGGITIRVNRSESQLYEQMNGTLENPIRTGNFKEHESETALDNAKFDYVIDNNGTLEELVEKVKDILIKEKIL